jgi:uncharacterized protein with beta-barrel porin domain
LGAGSLKALGNANLVMNAGTLMTVGGPRIVSIGGGNIQFNAGTYLAQVGGTVPGGAHDQLVTTGNVNLGGGVLSLVQQNGYQLAPGDKVNLILGGSVLGGTANGAQFADNQVLGLAAFSSTPLLVPRVNLYTTSVVLEAMQGSFAAINGQLFAGRPINFTPNQIATAIGLDSVSARIGFKTGVFSEMTFLSTQPLNTLQSNLDKLAPEELASIFTNSIALANVHSANVQRRTDDIRNESQVISASALAAAGSGPSYSGGMSGAPGKRSKEILPPSNQRWGMFLTGSGELTHVGSTTNAAGYRLESAGLTAGVDYRLSSKLAIGANVGYMGTSAKLINGGEINTEGGRLGLFATYYDQGYYVDAAVTGGLSTYKTRRTTPNNTSATGRPGGSEISFLVAGGYDWKFGGLTLGPTLSYQFTSVRLDEFTENGTFAPLKVSGQTAQSSRTAVGVRAYYDTRVLGVAVRPEARLAWQHEFGDNGFSITSNFATLGGNAFTVQGATTGRESLLMGGGFSVLWTDRFATYVYYDGEVRNNYDSHSISGGVRLQF